MKPTVTVGKAGVTDSVLAHIAPLLEQRELIKVRMAESPQGRRPAAESLANALDAELVDVIGSMVVLYRPNLQLPPRKQIHLPR